MQGYEEVHVPALKPKDFAPGEKLTPIADLPPWAQPAFKGMQTLNRVQSRVADMALKGVDNMLLCAPTGAGKTNVAMLAILHEIGKNLNEDNTLQLDNFKVVYVAPMKVSSSSCPMLGVVHTQQASLLRADSLLSTAACTASVWLNKFSAVACGAEAL